MSRIDHAAKAQKRIQWINEWQEREGDTAETHLADAMVAQAEATLALVEQQRIASLVALAVEDLTFLGRAAREALGYSAFHPDIAAALGIETAS